MAPLSEFRRRLSWLVVLVVAALACGGGRDSRAARANAVPLTFAFDLWAGYFPAVEAVGTGIFDSLGVRVDLRRPGNTKGLLADFAAGRHDLIGVSFADVPVLSNSVPDLRVILCSDESAGADAIVVRQGIANVAALRGKRIGVNLGGFAEIFVISILGKHGLRPEDVELVYTDAADVPARLQRGEVDAGETWEPYVSRAVAAGGRKVATTADVPGLIVDCIATRQSVLDRRGADVRRFVIGWFLGLDRWRADSNGARPLIAKALGIREDETPADGIRLLDLRENRARFNPDDPKSFLRAANVYSTYFSRTGAIRAPFSGRQVLTSAYLPE